MKQTFSLVLATLLLSSCGPQFHGLEAEDLYVPTLTAETLNESLELGTSFLLAHQKADGNFNYEYNYSEKTFNEDDSQVRQAGALWGLALINEFQEQDAVRSGIESSLAYFKEHSVLSENGRYIVYPGDEKGKTGTQALVVLALVDYLRSTNVSDSARYEQELEEYMSFLEFLRMENGQFYSTYTIEDGSPLDEPSPYFDGEALLAMVKAAKYLAYDGLEEKIEESAEIMHEVYVEDALKEDPDSDRTKGYYQWGSMAYYELYTSEWSKNKYAEWTIEMAYWMIDVHETLERSKNTGYAYEGLIVAHELARLTGDEEAEKKIAYTIDLGLSKLLSWQVTPALTADPLGIGGAPNEADGVTLRIDVTQHQMHAVILALKLVYSL